MGSLAYHSEIVEHDTHFDLVVCTDYLVLSLRNMGCTHGVAEAEIELGMRFASSNFVDVEGDVE